MPDQQPPPNVVLTEEGVVLTEEGAITPEEQAIREAAGTAAPEVAESVLLERARHEAVQQDADAPVTTFLERAASAATFGLLDVARGEESALEAGRRVEASPTAATLGTVAGTVVPGLLSGGTGTVGTLARLTPAGRVSAGTARIASTGGLGRVAVGGALEGMAGAAGDYVARVSLDEDVKFSAESLVGRALQGAALGGGIGLGVKVTGQGLEKLGRKLAPAEEKLGGLMGQADDVVAPPPSLITGRKKAPRKWTRYKQVVKTRLADDNADALRALGSRVDDMAKRSAVQELDDVITMDAFQLAQRADPELAGMAARARQAATELQESSAETRAWFGDYAQEVGLPTAKRRIVKTATKETEDAGAALIARTDELSVEYDRLIDELRARSGVPVPAAPGGPAAVQAGDAESRLGKTLGAVRDRLAPVRQIGDVVTGVAGMAEVAGMAVDTGLPRASDLPVVGPLLGYYLKYKGFKAAAKGTGLIPATKATQAATGVNQVESSLRGKVGSLATGTLKRASAKLAEPPVAGAAAKIARVLALSPADAAVTAASEMDGTTSAVQAAAARTAARAVEYLQQNAPRDPLPGRAAYMPTWEPPRQEAMRFERQLAAVEDPEAAIELALVDPFAVVELDAVRSVYPSLYQQVRVDLMDHADQLADQLSLAQMEALGHQFELPLTIGTTPGYGTVMPQPPPLQPQPIFSRPSTPGASPSVRLEDTSRRPR
jgi:hypothetical protein